MSRYYIMSRYYTMIYSFLNVLKDNRVTVFVYCGPKIAFFYIFWSRDSSICSVNLSRYALPWTVYCTKLSLYSISPVSQGFHVDSSSPSNVLSTTHTYSMLQFFTPSTLMTEMARSFFLSLQWSFLTNLYSGLFADWIKWQFCVGALNGFLYEFILIWLDVDNLVIKIPTF